MKRREFILKSTFTALATSVIPSSFLKTVDASGREMTLIDQTIHPRVLVAANASKSELYAAQELINYLEKITGQKLQVEKTDETPVIAASKPVIVIGSHPLNNALMAQISEMEETIIEAKPGIFHLAGGKPVITNIPNGTKYVQDRGALYAVYNFLDELGVRWYKPGESGEHVPRSSSVKVLLGRRQFKPVYWWRMGFYGYSYDHDGNPPEGLIWAVRNRQNINLNATEELGGWRAVQTQHNYHNLFPAKKYFSQHPEYFALVNGVRRDDGQLCLGNPEVQHLTATHVVQFAGNNRHETFSLEPNDNDIWCQCELCKALDDPNQKSIWGKLTLDLEKTMGDVSMSNRVNAFGKIVANEVAKSNKNIKLFWLAYSTHTEPPSKIHDLPPNTLLHPAAFSSAFSDPQDSYSDYSRDLYDPQSQPNRNYVRILKGFGKMTRMIAHEYWSGIAWFGPMPLIATMKDRLNQYRKFPIDGVNSEMHPHWGPQGIDLYFYTRLLWNPDLEVEKELDLYCKNYYGPAYKPMLRYHQLLEKAAHSGIPHYSYGIGTHAIFTAEVMQKMDELINQAKVLLGEKQPYAKRFEGVWAGYEYTRLVTPYFDELKKGNKLEAAKHWERGNKFILSFKEGDVFNNAALFGSLQSFGNYNLNIPADIQNQAKEFVAQEIEQL